MINLSAEIIANGVTYEIRNLSSIEFSGQDRSEPTRPCWGIKSNSGTLEMRDTDDVILSLHKSGILGKSKISIYLNANSRKQLIGGFYVVEAFKQIGEGITTIHFKDELENWQNIQMDKYYYPYLDNKISISTILNTLLGKAGKQLRYANETTGNYLENFLMTCPIIEAGTLWAQMSKICEVGACYIYCDDKGFPNIIYSGGT
jgi:hypothetical protein